MTDQSDDATVEAGEAGEGMPDLDELLAQAKELAASVAESLSPQDRDEVAAELAAGKSGPEEETVEAGEAADVDSLLTAVDQLGQDLAGELGRAVTSSEDDSEPHAAEGAQTEGVEPGPEAAQSVTADDAPPAEPIVEPQPDSEKEKGSPTEDAAATRTSEAPGQDDRRTPAAAGTGVSGFRLLWWAVLQSPPVLMLDRVLTMVNAPFARVPKNIKDVAGYGGVLMAVLGAAGLGLALFGR